MSNGNNTSKPTGPSPEQRALVGALELVKAFTDAEEALRNAISVVLGPDTEGPTRVHLKVLNSIMERQRDVLLEAMGMWLTEFADLLHEAESVVPPNVLNVGPVSVDLHVIRV